MKPFKLLVTLMVLVLGPGVVGCASHTGEGALIGGAGGALAGAAIGSHSHGRAGPGALVGGAIGAIGGALVGNELDRQERDRYYGSRYDRGGYARGRYYDDYDYGYERRVYRPRYRRTVRYYEYDDCAPRYRHSHHGHGHGGRYYRSTYYGY